MWASIRRCGQVEAAAYGLQAPRVSVSPASLLCGNCGDRIPDLPRLTNNVLVLANLYTDPKHQGRGAAGVLIQRFIEDAKAKGLPAYLDSSEGAHKLYLKYEFRDVEELLTDLSKWGLEEPHRVWAMVREP